MDYNRLKTFVMVAELGSVTGGARALHRTQSAISQQLKAFEEELGLALFSRVSGRLVLTQEGKRLRQVARDALSEIDHVFAELREGRASERGLLRLASVGEFLDPGLAPLLGLFRAAHPEVELRVRVSDNATVERWLLDDEVDLGVLVTYSHRHLLERSPFVSVECIVVAAPSYIEHRGPLRSYASVVDAELIDLSEQCAWIGTWVAKNAPRLSARLKKCAPTVVVPSHAAIKAIVQAGVGVGLVPRVSVEAELGSGELIEIMPRARPVVVTADLAVPAHARGRRLVQLFLNFAQDRGVEQSGPAPHVRG